MQVLSVSTSDIGVTFVNPKTEKAEFTAYQDAISLDQAIKHLKMEVKTRGVNTNSVLSVLVKMFDNPLLDSYKGQTTIHSAIRSEAKATLREVEDAFIKPLFLASLPKSLSTAAQQEEWAGYIKELREPGIYSTVKSMAFKYFCHMGKLPCAYEGDHPDASKLMPVSAMQKIMNNEKARVPSEHKDNSIPAKLGEQMQRMIAEKDTLSAVDLANVISRIELFLSEAKQLQNSAALAATETLQKLGIVTAESGGENPLGTARKVKKQEAALV